MVLDGRACDPGMVGGSAMQFELHVDAYTIVTAVVLLILAARCLPARFSAPGATRGAGQSTAS